MIEAINGLNRTLVIAQTSRTLSPVFVSTKQVLPKNLVVFAYSDASVFAILASTLHIEWVIRYGSTMRTDMRYLPTECFETFPFPIQFCQLADGGEIHHELRRMIMFSRQEGLTQTYNRFHEPDESSADIQNLRELHVGMDKAVAVAYGWSDLELGHGFHDTKQGVRFTISEPARREVLQRLLKLNHERYAEEVKQGLHVKKKSGEGLVTGGGKKKPASKPKSATPMLFDIEEEGQW